MHPEVHKLLIKADGLAVTLTNTRVDTGLNGKEFASRIRWDPAKLSRTEAGQRLITKSELELWISAAAVAPDLAAHMRSELRAALDAKPRLKGESRLADQRDASEFPGLSDDAMPDTPLAAYQRGYADALRDVRMQLQRLEIPSASDLAAD